MPVVREISGHSGMRKTDAKIGAAIHLVRYKLVQLFGTIDLWLAWRLLSAQRPFGFIRPCGLINT